MLWLRRAVAGGPPAIRIRLVAGLIGVAEAGQGGARGGEGCLRGAASTSSRLLLTVESGGGLRERFHVFLGACPRFVVQKVGHGLRHPTDPPTSFAWWFTVRCVTLTSLLFFLVDVCNNRCDSFFGDCSQLLSSFTRGISCIEISR